MVALDEPDVERILDAAARLREHDRQLGVEEAERQRCERERDAVVEADRRRRDPDVVYLDTEPINPELLAAALHHLDRKPIIGTLRMAVVR
jgi:hypothetical protein